MPQGGKPVRIKEGCPNCGNDAYEIWWKDGFGLEELLERHCNQCGWAIDPNTGVVRNKGRKLPPLMPRGRLVRTI